MFSDKFDSEAVEDINLILEVIKKTVDKTTSMTRGVVLCYQFTSNLR